MRRILGSFLVAWLTGIAVSSAAQATRPSEHWAFLRPVRPTVPHTSSDAWVRNPIDAFIAAERERRGLKHAPEADRATLLRRVYIDLIGLPPTRQELHAFLDDAAPDAYERVVDRLLDDARYGERWGRHWMDIWRYSDWAGYMSEVRDSQPFIWRWRDWIIESLNDDKGYDRMVSEMLAADELEPGNADALRATGFLVRNWYKFNRNVWLDRDVEHTAKAFLGLTVNCARCHDHKYDPVSQREYYQFRAIFEPHNVHTQLVPGRIDTTSDGMACAYDADAFTPTYLFVRGDEKRPDTSANLAPGVPAVLGGTFDVKPIALPPLAYYPGLRPEVQAGALATVKGAVEQAQAELAKAETALAKLDAGAEAATKNDALQTAQRARDLARLKLASSQAERDAMTARIAADRAKYATPSTVDADELTRVASRAERQAALCKAEQTLAAAEQQLDGAIASADAKPTDEKLPKTVEQARKNIEKLRRAKDDALAALDRPSSTYTPLGGVFPNASTGRRLALAQWLTSAENPLTARVAVNHIWGRHFGESLVRTVFDFGRNGKPPTHPELLDWLACELQSSGWRMKPIHRLIITSATYRMSSASPADAPELKTDPDNVYLWRMPSRRMEAEVVRDSVLYVAGHLDLQRGGPDLDSAQGLTLARRSLYFRHAQEKQMPLLEIFDAASPSECYRRDQSVMPQQALALANSSLVLAQSRLLAADLTKEAGPSSDQSADERFISIAFEQMLSRAPKDAERTACVAFLAEQARRLADAASLQAFNAGDASPVTPSIEAPQRAREGLIHVLMNHNDFVTVR